jgi:hypothetical protein
MNVHTYQNHHFKHIAGDYEYENTFYEKPTIINLCTKEKIDASIFESILNNRELKTFDSLLKYELCKEMIDISSLIGIINAPNCNSVISQYICTNIINENGGVVGTYKKKISGNICVLFMNGPYFYLLYEYSDHIKQNISSDTNSAECSTIIYTCNMRICRYGIRGSKLHMTYSYGFDLDIIKQGTSSHNFHISMCRMFINDNKLIIDIDNKNQKQLLFSINEAIYKKDKYLPVLNCVIMIFDLETKSKQLIDGIYFKFQRTKTSFLSPSQLIYGNRFIYGVNPSMEYCVIDMHDNNKIYVNTTIKQVGSTISLHQDFVNGDKTTHVFTSNTVSTNQKIVIPSELKDPTDQKIVSKDSSSDIGFSVNAFSSEMDEDNSQTKLYWSIQKTIQIEFNIEIVDNTMIITAEMENTKYEYNITIIPSPLMISIDYLFRTIKSAVKKSSKNVTLDYKVNADTIEMNINIDETTCLSLLELPIILTKI